MLTKYIKIFIIITIIALSSPSVLFAQTSGGANNNAPSLIDNLETIGGAAQYDTTKNSVPFFAALVGQIIGVFIGLLGVIFMGLIIYGGWLWMSDKGNEENVQKAKILIRNAILGLIIVVAAYAITYFVISALSAYNTNLTGF